MASVSAVIASSAVVAGAALQPQGEKPKQIKPRKALRPNYSEIHQHLLPVEVHPLPTLIPHNPVSVVAVALSYLTRVVAPPKRPTYNGYFSSTTSLVHVTDHDSIRALWEMGFFGRGNLSRSEPTWEETQKKRGITAEENTGQRRTERRQMKLERARKEQDDVQQQLLKENHEQGELKDEGAKVAANILNKAADVKLEDVSTDDAWRESAAASGLPTPPPSVASEAEPERPITRLHRSKTVRFSPTIEAREFDLSSPTISPLKSPGSSVAIQETEAMKPPPSSSTAASYHESSDKEHLNLSMEEAFFLSYGLGVLNVYCEDSDTIMSPSSLLSLFRRHSYHPTHSLSVPQQPDDPFMLSYVVYHHYRSLGWVVRSGVKFSTDFLLYNRGPAFAHAEFAIVVLPSYTHPYWSDTHERIKYVMTQTRKSWDWLHGVNRVQAQVHKSLILCYVEVPPPHKVQKGQDVDVGKMLSRYTVRDVSVKRWTPNRTRD